VRVGRHDVGQHRSPSATWVPAAAIAVRGAKPGRETLALASIAALGPDFVPYDRAVIHRTGQRGRWSASRDSCRRGWNCHRLLRLETNRPSSPSCGDHAPKRALEPVLSSAIGTSAARSQQIDLALGASYAGPDLLRRSAPGPRSSTTATPGGHARKRAQSSRLPENKWRSRSDIWLAELMGLEPLTFSLRRLRVQLVGREHRVLHVYVEPVEALWLPPGNTHGAHGGG
jgi:hypothetical protein